MTYPDWLSEVHRLLAIMRPDVQASALDPNASFAAWKGGLPPNIYVQNAVSFKGHVSLSMGGHASRNTYSLHDQDELERRFQRFHFGAFAIPYVWGPLHNKDILFWTLPLCFIAFVGWIFTIGLSVWAGVNGYRWAWESGRFKSLKEMDDTEGAWISWGIVWFIITFVIGFTVGFYATYRQ
jgi:hypothetical protein